MTTSQDQARQDLAALTRLLQDLAGDMSPVHRQRLKDQLITEIQRPDAARSPRRGWPRATGPRARRRGALLIVGAGMAVAGVAAAMIAIGLTSRDGLPPASPAAVRLLAQVADAAARRPAVQVRDSQYMYAEITEASASLPGNLQPYIVKGTLPPRLRQHFHLGKPVTSQYWMPVADECRLGLLRITPAPKDWPANQLFTARGSGTRCPSIGGLNDATYRLLQTLPTDPHALLAMIYRVEQGHGPSADREAFVTIGDLLRDKIVPPKVSAALYRAAALIPGVTLVPSATDAIGRHGVAVAQTVEGLRTELIFNKTSLKLIGERTVLARIGFPIDVTAIISQGFADHIGQAPMAPGS